MSRKPPADSLYPPRSHDEFEARLALVKVERNTARAALEQALAENRELRAQNERLQELLRQEAKR